jgi:hypothetical protein
VDTQGMLFEHVGAVGRCLALGWQTGGGRGTGGLVLGLVALWQGWQQGWWARRVGTAPSSPPVTTAGLTEGRVLSCIDLGDGLCFILTPSLFWSLLYYKLKVPSFGARRASECGRRALLASRSTVVGQRQLCRLPQVRQRPTATPTVTPHPCTPTSLTSVKNLPC